MVLAELASASQPEGSSVPGPSAAGKPLPRSGSLIKIYREHLFIPPVSVNCEIPYSLRIKSKNVCVMSFTKTWAHWRLEKEGVARIPPCPWHELCLGLFLSILEWQRLDLKGLKGCLWLIEEGSEREGVSLAASSGGEHPPWLH